MEVQLLDLEDLVPDLQRAAGRGIDLQRMTVVDDIGAVGSIVELERHKLGVDRSDDIDR